MSSDRIKPTVTPQRMVMRADGRYLRWSHRYNAWQVRLRDGAFINVSVPMARAYAASGLPIGTQT